MARKIIILSLVLGLLVSCGFIRGLQVTDSERDQLLAYGSGRAMGFLVKAGEIKGLYSKDLQSDLTAAWDSMMERNVNNDWISGQEITLFYNEILQIVVKHKGDKYGLFADLTMILSLYSARISPDTGEMEYINPVPYLVMKRFEFGYDLGMQTAEHTIHASTSRQEVEAMVKVLRNMPEPELFVRF